MIRVVTDSTSQLSDAQATPAGITIVPMTIIIDGHEYREGVDLSTEGFYDMIGEGVRLSTSQPPPGTFIETYASLIDEGATEIVSVHLSEASSGTLNSARVAATGFDVPIHLIDSKMTSYGLGVIALAVAEHVDATGSTRGAAGVAAELIPQVATTFILQDLRYVLKGGRMREPELPTGADDIPVLAGSGGGYQLVGTGRSIDDLVAQMASQLLDGDHRRHVAIAHAAPDTIDFTEGLEARMRDDSRVDSVHRYRMGPSIAVHTGPGTAGGFSWPA